MTEEAVAQAQTALKNFRALQPTLNAYARMLTGRPDVRVVAAVHDNGSTDGKVINYRPPISLGKTLPHERWHCDRRDEYGNQKCAACAQREDILTTIYHEIAHIWFDSFQGITDEAKKKAIKAAVERVDGVYAEKIKAKLKFGTEGLGYMGLAAFVSPFFPLLLNALEDARVNRELFRALPGTKVMFDASTARTFKDGVEQLGKGGEWIKDHWRDRPLNMQAIIGVFCMASGYDFSTWLHEFVVESLNDAKLKDLVGELSEVGSVDSTFSLAFPVLARLRELGFCRDETDPVDDFEPPYTEPSDADEESKDDEPSGAGGDTGSEESDDSPGSGGNGSPSSDDDGSRGDAGPSNDDGKSEEPAGEVGDEADAEAKETDGGDPSRGRAEGPETDGADSTESVGSDPDGAGDPEAESGESEDGVPEEDFDRDKAEPGTAPGPGDSTHVRDGEAESGRGLDGSDRADRREPDDYESGGDSDDSSGDASDWRIDPESGRRSDLEGADDLLDTGDEPGKGVRIEGDIKPSKPPLPWGDAEDIEIVVHEMGHHEPPSSVHVHDDGPPHEHRSEEDEEGDAVVKAVMVAGMYFEMPSAEVIDVKILNEANGFFSKDYAKMTERGRRVLGVDAEVDPPESVIGPAISRARVVFADNSRGKNEIGLRRGQVHGPSVGRRAPVGDDRFFRLKRLPGTIDYFVGIGVDVSASTAGAKIKLAKQVAFAEAELLSRLGIPFFVYGHSGSGLYRPGAMTYAYSLDMIEIKRSDEPWNDVTRNRLRQLGPRAANLDGHTIQFYRKILEKQRAKQKILHYYSDGAMPCENYGEEMDILTAEIKRYQRQGIILRGVGIRTDAPRQHGLPTVIVREQKDVMKVVEDLAEQIIKIKK